MKKVIIVSYQFPPCGGKAVQRAAKLAKYLPQFGWQPVIFTMPVGERGVPVDHTLMADLPGKLEIHRHPWRDWWRHVPHNIRKHFYNPVPDKYRSWADSAVESLIRLIRFCAPVALITTSPSHSVQILGLAARRNTGIPWVADFRDPWTGHEDFSMKPQADYMVSIENDVITEADAVVGVYPKILRGFEGRTDAGKLHLIENGFDEDDFRLVDRSLHSAPGQLVVGYNGTVSRFHDPSPLLETVRNMLRTAKIGPGDVRFVFTTNASGRKWFEPWRDLTDAGILNIRPYLPHAESLAGLAAMDVSLVISTYGRDIYPAKVFEYFNLGNPVLLVGDAGDDLACLVNDSGTGIVADERDSASMRDIILDLCAQKRNGTLPRLTADPARIGRFSRRAIAEQYAALLDSITAV